VSGSFATNAIGTLTYDAATGALYAGTGEPNASGDSEAGFGIYKSTDGGNTWTHLAANTTVPVMATPCGDAPAYTGPAFDGRATSSIVVRGNSMYVGDGNTGSPAARFYRSDDVATGSPTFTDLTTTQNEDYCTGQCWYDNVVYSPPGKPDVVYLGGSYSYGSYGFTTNGRAFIRS